jgi:signal transduction histidine kinase
VHNAIHYNRRGGTVTVEVGEHPALVVVNTGPKVRPEQVNALFEPFRRLDGDRTAHRAGAGLGLSIVRSVAKAHGGTVAATPNPAGGLRVTVKFPVCENRVAKDTTSPQVSLSSGGGD